MELNPEQKKRAKRLSNLVAKGNLAILEYLDELEEKIEKNTLEIKEEIAKEVPSLKEIVSLVKGDDGHTPTPEELTELIAPLIPEAKNGDNYVLTDEDKAEIATLALMDIELPTVEKVIEKVEVIRETPIVTENVVEKAVPDTGEQTRDKLEALTGDERLDVKAIKGLDKFEEFVTRADLERGLSIVDNRTSFLLNKINNLTIPSSSSGLSQAEADARYLQLTTANGPLTGNLFVTKTDAKLRATDNTGSINYSELFANSTEVGFNFSIIDGESTGAIRYDGVSFSLSTNLSDAYTFSSSALLYSSGTSSSTQPAFYIIGDRAISGTNTNGGDVVITPGISRGSGTSKSILQASGGGASGTADSNPATVATFAHNAVTFVDPYDFVFGTTTGTKLGTGTSQKIAFHGSTPVIQRAGAAQAAVATTAATNTTPFGYTTAAQADAIVTLVNEIRAALVQKGIIKGSA